MSRLGLHTTILLTLLRVPLCLVAQENGEPKEVQGQVVVRISPETTVISGPLTKDGFVDFVAAANKFVSKGVTPENNGAIEFVQIMDPDNEWGFFKVLGIEEPTLPAFLKWHDHVNKIAPNSPPLVVQQLLDERSKLQWRPWKSTDNATASLWLTANKRALDALVESTKKEEFYTPLISVDNSLVGALLPAVQESRELARILLLRAMQRLGDGDHVGAWSDLQACHRLARQVSQGFTIIERLVGIAIERMALSADVTFVQSAVLAPEEIGKYRLQIVNLPAISSMADAIDNCERWMFLDSTQLVARKGVAALDGLTGQTNSLPPFLNRLIRSSVDWNEVMIMGNDWYDRCVEIARTESVLKRRLASQRFDTELQGLAPNISNLTGAAKLLFSSKKTKGREIGAVLVSLLLPAVEAAASAENRVQDYGQMVEIAFALEAYKIKYEQYPQKLVKLTPALLTKIPQDIFKQAPYTYESDGSTYLLYGVGFNFEDDGAKRGVDNVVTSNDWKMRD